MSDNYSEAPRHAVGEFLKTVEFDSAVILTYDRRTGGLTNWWHFSGHPKEWLDEELTQLAWKITSHAAECMKSDVNNPGQRKIVVEQPRVVANAAVRASENGVMLFALSFARKVQRKRIYFYLCAQNEIGVTIRWYSGALNKGRAPYWGATLLLGFLSLHVIVDK